jgi:hypothetical protein
MHVCLLFMSTEFRSLTGTDDHFDDCRPVGFGIWITPVCVVRETHDVPSDRLAHQMIMEGVRPRLFYSGWCRVVESVLGSAVLQEHAMNRGLR